MHVSLIALMVIKPACGPLSTNSMATIQDVHEEVCKFDISRGGFHSTCHQ